MAPQDPMLPYLVDLEQPFDASRERPYDPVEFVRYALTVSEYWADLAVAWLEQGLPARQLQDSLLEVQARTGWPQSLRHRARAVSRTAI